MRLVFLLLMAGDSVSARWILFLQMISSEFSRFKSSVRLVLLFIADAPGVGDGDEILLLRGGSGVLRPSCEVSGLSLVRKGDDLDSPMGCLLRATVAGGSGSGSVGRWTRGRWWSWCASVFSGRDAADMPQG